MDAGSIVKLICSNDGSMRYNMIEDCYSWHFDGIGSVIEGNDLFATVFRNGEKTVIAKTKVKLCRAKDCGGCTNLHLCKFFLFGDCPYGRGRRGCRFSHDLTTQQNSRVLQLHGLSHLDRRELCILLLQSDSSLLPQVCHSYNNGAGPYGRCQDGDTCKRLHICQKYLQGSCNCARSHDFYEPHPLKTLQDRGVPTDLMPYMKTVYSNIEALRKLDKGNGRARAGDCSGQRTFKEGKKQTGANAGEKTEICMYFVKGHCKHGEKCFKEHTKVPYKWEVDAGNGWEALPDNEGIEKDYCNPDKTCSSGISFDMMTRMSHPVRRLSTVSSVTQPNFILTTKWMWYWEDEYSNWIQYASSDGGHNLASITSEDLEQRYIQDDKADVEFSAGSQSYTLSFQDMIQTNKRYGTKKLVRRRPAFVSAADAQTIRTSKPAPSNQMKTLPTHWNKTLVPETGYKRVLLQSDLTEYKKIETLFNSTMRGYNIQKLERIQNKSLWEVFQWQKDQMKKKNSGRDVAERQLFHGTDSKHMEAICRENFDWRICGTHGTAYGKGSYFARDAKYSHGYTGDSATRCMFVCRVLVGDYTKGESSYVRPPYKGLGDTISYDSCVNDVHNPSIFVVFEKHQIYPEYLITYNDGNSLSSMYNVPRRVYSQPAQTPVQTPMQTPAPTYRSTPATVTYSPPSYSYNPPPTPQKDNSCVIC